MFTRNAKKDFRKSSGLVKVMFPVRNLTLKNTFIIIFEFYLLLFLQIKDNDVHSSHIKELEGAIEEMKVNMENMEKVWQRAFLQEK